MTEEKRSPYDHLFDRFNAERTAPPSPPPKKKGFLGLFGRGPDEPQAPPARGPQLAVTNAPPHWPEVRLAWTSASGPRGCAIMQTHLISVLAEWSGDVRLKQLAATRLHEDGILYAPFEVEDRGARAFVFIYPDAGPESAAHFAAVTRGFREVGEPAPVYYAPAPLPDAPPGDAFKPFGAAAFTLLPDPSEAPCAAWWATEDDAEFPASATRAAMERVNVALDGIHSYVLAAWMREHREGFAEVGRVALPRGGVTLALQGPEDRPVWFSANAEKGIRLHFPKEAPRAYRERLWRLFAGYAEGWRAQVEENRWEKDPPQEDGPAEHWRVFVRSFEIMRAQGMRPEAVGVLQTIPADATARPTSS